MKIILINFDALLKKENLEFPVSDKQFENLSLQFKVWQESLNNHTHAIIIFKTHAHKKERKTLENALATWLKNHKIKVKKLENLVEFQHDIIDYLNDDNLIASKEILLIDDDPKNLKIANDLHCNIIDIKHPSYQINLVNLLQNPEIKITYNLNKSEIDKIIKTVQDSFTEITQCDFEIQLDFLTALSDLDIGKLQSVKNKMSHAITTPATEELIIIFQNRKQPEITQILFDTIKKETLAYLQKQMQKIGILYQYYNNPGNLIAQLNQMQIVNAQLKAENDNIAGIITRQSQTIKILQTELKKIQQQNFNTSQTSNATRSTNFYPHPVFSTTPDKQPNKQPTPPSFTKESKEEEIPVKPKLELGEVIASATKAADRINNLLKETYMNATVKQGLNAIRNSLEVIRESLQATPRDERLCKELVTDFIDRYSGVKMQNAYGQQVEIEELQTAVAKFLESGLYQQNQYGYGSYY